MVGTTKESVNAAFNQIYLIAKRNLSITNPKLSSLLGGLSGLDTGDEENISRILEIFKEAGEDGGRGRGRTGRGGSGRFGGL